MFIKYQSINQSIISRPASEKWSQVEGGGGGRQFSTDGESSCPNDVAARFELNVHCRVDVTLGQISTWCVLESSDVLVLRGAKQPRTIGAVADSRRVGLIGDF